ncbi:MAG: OmpA family protein [Muribaculaceae bacterium]|nr:OmpA family protein [Muribaculaceae bacterium]
MKNRLKTLFKSVTLSLLVSVAYCSPVWGQTAGKVQSHRHEALDEMSFTEMINSVVPDEKSADLIRRFQEKEARDRVLKSYGLNRNGCNVETYRNKEVLLITIPASKLFAPNSTELRADVDAYLAPLKRYLREPDMYRMLIVMHTDNTGSEEYREKITEERSTAVFDWFENQNLDTEYLFSYAYADELPLTENNSMSNRDKNRRLEIYLVPGSKMLEQAKKGRIVY